MPADLLTLEIKLYANFSPSKERQWMAPEVCAILVSIALRNIYKISRPSVKWYHTLWALAMVKTRLTLYSCVRRLKRLYGSALRRAHKKCAQAEKCAGKSNCSLSPVWLQWIWPVTHKLQSFHALAPIIFLRVRAYKNKINGIPWQEKFNVWWWINFYELFTLKVTCAADRN